MGCEKHMILAGTGHRPNKLNKEWDMDGPMSFDIMTEIADSFDELKPTKIITGMALGYDMLLAQVAIFHKLPVIAAIPFPGQELKWSKKAQEIYNTILSNPLVEKNILTEGGFSNWKMHHRNKWMCNNANAVLACWNGVEDGGTAACLDYAHQKGLQIYNVWKQEWVEKYGL